MLLAFIQLNQTVAIVEIPYLDLTIICSCHESEGGVRGGEGRGGDGQNHMTKQANVLSWADLLPDVSRSRAVIRELPWTDANSNTHSPVTGSQTFTTLHQRALEQVPCEM